MRNSYLWDGTPDPMPAPGGPPVWVYVDGRKAHPGCVAEFNSVIHVGSKLSLDCGDCECCMSARFSGPMGPKGKLLSDLRAAWDAISREERAKRLGQDINEWQDGFATRLSHEMLTAHVGGGEREMRAALAALVAP